MNGTFKITLAYLKELGACRDGQREFQKAFPEGGEYQEVLDRCAEEGRLDFASWLLERIGATDDVRTYESAVDTPEMGIIFAGKIEFKMNVSVKFIKAGGDIKAGLDSCVFAGLNIKKRSQWKFFAVVTAKVKPANLMSGFWKPLEGSDEESLDDIFSALVPATARPEEVQTGEA